MKVKCWLWSSIALAATAPMGGLHQVGAFTGTTATAAYSVAFDATTTPTGDPLGGIVNLSVGFAPADGEEFVLLNIPVEVAAVGGE